MFNSHETFCKRNLDESIIDEQLNKLLLSRKAHIGTLTKRINKITSLLNNLNNKEALETENSKLDYTINEIQKITSKYCSMQTDEIKINRAREISTEQEFRVIQIWKSIDHFLFKYFPETDLVSTCSKLSENHKESKLKAISSLTFPYQDTDGPNLNLSAVLNNPVVEADSLPFEPHKVPPRPNHLEPKFRLQQNKLDEINKTLDFEIQKLERKINRTKIHLEQETSIGSQVAFIREGGNLYLKSNSILDWKSVATPKTVKTPRENQNLNTCKNCPPNTQDFSTQYSASSIFTSFKEKKQNFHMMVHPFQYNKA